MEEEELEELSPEDSAALISARIEPTVKEEARASINDETKAESGPEAYSTKME